MDISKVWIQRRIGVREGLQPWFLDMWWLSHLRIMSNRLIYSQGSQNVDVREDKLCAQRLDNNYFELVYPWLVGYQLVGSIVISYNFIYGFHVQKTWVVFHLDFLKGSYKALLLFSSRLFMLFLDNALILLNLDPWFVLE